MPDPQQTGDFFPALVPEPDLGPVPVPAAAPPTPAQPTPLPQTPPPAPATFFPTPPPDALTESMRQSADVAPDAAARIMKLQAQTGLPADVIARNLDAVERANANHNFDPEKLRADSPALANWMAQHPMNAAVARDDITPLTAVESAIKFAKVAGRQAWAGYFQGMNLGAWGLLEAAGDVLKIPALSAWAKDQNQRLQYAVETIRGTYPGGPYEGPMSAPATAAASGFGMLGGAIPAMLPAFMSGGASEGLTLGLFGSQMGGEAYGQAREAGLGVGKSLAFGALQGSVGAMAPKLPLEALLGDIVAKSGLPATLLHQILPAIGGMQVATALQDYDEWAYIHPDRPFQEYLDARPGAAMHTLIATLVMNGLQTGAIHTISRYAGGASAGRAVDDLSKAAASSKVAVRSPEQFTAFVQHAAEHGQEHFYVPADTFTEYFQGKGIDPATKAFELTGDATAYERAKSGPDLEVPAGRLAAELAANTGDHPFYKSEVRLTPDTMNEREATAFRETALKATPAAQEPGIARIERISTDVAAQLEARGYTAEGARTNAELLARLIGIPAVQAGVDPAAVYQRYGFTVTREVSPLPTRDAGATLPGGGEAQDDPGAARVRLDLSRGTGEPTPAAAGGSVDAGRLGAGAQEGGAVTVPDAFREHFAGVLADARTNGYAGSDDSLANTYLQNVADAKIVAAESAVAAEGDDRSWRGLLQAVADAGGIGVEANAGKATDVGGRTMRGGHRGEVQALLDAFDRQLAGGRKAKPVKPGETAKRRPKMYQRLAGDIAGIRGIVKKTGGETLDRVLEALHETGGFQHIESLSDLIEAVRAAVHDAQDATSGNKTPAVQLLGILEGLLDVRPGGGWWREAPADLLDAVTLDGEPLNVTDAPDSFDVDLYQDLFDRIGPDPNPPVDRLATPKIDDLQARRLGMPAELQHGLNLIAEEATWRKAVTTPGSLVTHNDGFTGRVVEGATDPVNGRGKAQMALVEHEFEGQTVQRWYPATELDAAKLAERPDTVDSLPDKNAVGHTGLPTDLPAGKSTHVSGLPDGAAFERLWNGSPVVVRLRTIDGRERWTVNAVTFGSEKGLIFHEGWRWITEDTQPITEAPTAADVAAERAAQVDVLATGEVQPRLPGDVGDVRNQEVVQPPVAEPVAPDFELTAPDETQPKQTSLFQSAYHGTRHEFDEFSLHAIGTGQGAASFGWGLYFASSRELADRYRRELAGPEKGKHLAFNAPDETSVESGDIFKDGGLLHHDAGDPRNAAYELTERERSGVYELSARATFAPAGPEGLRRIRDDLVKTIANYETLHAETKATGVVQTFSGDEGQDAYHEQQARDALAVLDRLGDKLEIKPAGKPGRTYTVELPDDEHYLDWDKPASKQSAVVQAALRNLGVTWTTFKPLTVKEFIKWTTGPTYDRLFREDIGIRESLVQGERLAWAATQPETSAEGRQRNVEALERWQTDHQAFFEKFTIDPLGERLYEQLSREQMGANQKLERWSQGARLASEALAREGIAGIRYLDGFSRAKGEGTSNFVVFDPKLIHITEYDQPVGPPELTPDALDAWVAHVKGEVGPDLLHFDVRLNADGSLHLDTLAVTRGAQRSGIGSDVMTRLAQLADAQHLTLSLNLADRGYLREDTKGTTSRSRLADFYKRFGFVENKGRNKRFELSASMYRDPSEPAAKLGTPKPSPDLIVQHNLTTANLRHALKLGGIPVPSLAITRVGEPSTNFGEITLVGPREMADPRGPQRTRVFGSDAYSPRYPAVEFRVDSKALGRLNEILAPFREGKEREIYGAEIDGPDDLHSFPQFKRWVEKRYPDYTNHFTDYRAAGRELLGIAGAQERIFQGFTPGGNRRYVPHTLENVVRILKKDLRGGESSNNLYGVGQLRAKFTPEFRSITAIKEARNRIISDAQFEAVKKEVDTAFFSIVDALRPTYKHAGAGLNPFQFPDTVMAVMEDTPRLGLDKAFVEYGFEGVPDATKRDFAEFLVRLREMPTKYFEGKVLRAVQLREFAGAVVPEDAPADVVKALTDAGLTVTRYAGGGGKENPARRAAVGELANQLGDRVLFQNEKERRGVLRFGPDRQMNLALFEQADPTTFIHEAGHFGLEVFNDLADYVRTLPEEGRTDNQRRLLDDQAAIFHAIGVTDRAELTRNSDAHERFTESFSQYLLKGEAPSIGLRRAFARIRSWLLAFYRSLRPKMSVMNPDLKAVFDRMLATDKEIADAQAEGEVSAKFLTPEAAGMSHRQFELYSGQIEDASRVAQEELQRKILAELQREQTQQWKDRRAEIRGQVEAETHAKPVYQALAGIRRGTKPDGSPLIDGAENPTPAKLSRQALVDEFGKDRLKRLPKGTYAATGGMDPGEVADLFGFSSADELLKALEEAAPMADVIDHETDRRMVTEHGTMLLDGSLHERARAAVSNDYREQVLRTELRALAELKRTARPFIKEGDERVAAANAERAYERRWFAAEGKLAVAKAKGAKQAEIDALDDEVKNLRRQARGGAVTIRAAIPPDTVIREIATARTNAMPITMLKPETFWSAARRASRQAKEKAARQDFNGAIAATQMELLNNRMYRTVSDAREDVDARVRRVAALQSPAAQRRIGLAGNGILEQVNALLARFGFAPDRGVTPPPMREWIAALEADAYMPGLDQLPIEVIEPGGARTPFSQLTYERLVGVTDGLDQLVHLATLQNELLRQQDEREFAIVRDRLTDSILSNTPVRRKPLEFQAADLRWQSAREWYAEHAKMATLLLSLDGGQDGGPMWEALQLPANEASDREVGRKRETAQAYYDLLDRYYSPRELAHFSDKQYIGAINDSLSKEARLEVLKNFGNKTSRDRMLSDPVRKWNESQVQAIIDTLDRRDTEYVQAHWDFLNTFWPEIAAKSKRLTGVEPVKVEALAVQTPWGELRGGYHPLVYDGRLDVNVNRTEAITEAKLAVAGAYMAATTQRGHEQIRLQHLARPIRLEMSTTFAHFDQVIHDLTHHEMLIDTTRLLRDRKLARAIQDTHGDVVYRQLGNILQDIAQGDRPRGGRATRMEKSANWLRSRSQMAGLAYNLWTGVQQPLGLFNGMERVGAGWVTKGAVKWLRDAASMQNTAHWIASVSPMMKERLGGRGLTVDLQDVQNSLARRGGWFDKLVRTVSADHVTQKGLLDSYMWHIGLMQSVADVPTWLGEYEKQMASDADETRAARLADQAVLDSQGGAHIKDLAQVQRGGALAKLWMTFASYSLTVLNASARAAIQTDFRSPASTLRFAARLSMLYVVPALMTEILRCGVGRAKCDHPATFIGRVAGQSVTTALNGIVFVRELVSAANVAIGTDVGTHGYEGTASTRPMQVAINLAVQLHQGRWDDGAERAGFAAAGMLFNFPALQAERSIDGWVALSEHKTRNPLALLFGPPPQKSYGH